MNKVMAIHTQNDKVFGRAVSLILIDMVQMYFLLWPRLAAYLASLICRVPDIQGDLAVGSCDLVTTLSKQSCPVMLCAEKSGAFHQRLIALGASAMLAGSRSFSRCAVALPIRAWSAFCHAVHMLFASAAHAESPAQSVDLTNRVVMKAKFSRSFSNAVSSEEAFDDWFAVNLRSSRHGFPPVPRQVAYCNVHVGLVQLRNIAIGQRLSLI